MGETFISCITQISTTLITVGVTILVAYRTYRSEKIKEEEKTRRLQNINLRSSLELLRAYTANLLPFIPVDDVHLETSLLRTYTQKMGLLEQYLSELTETNLPDTFIEEFRYYRLMLAFRRISIEAHLSTITEKTIPSSDFHDLEILPLITSLNDFISSYSSEKTEG